MSKGTDFNLNTYCLRFWSASHGFINACKCLLTNSMQTTGNRDNLIATKTITRRFSVQHFMPLCVSLMTDGCYMVPDWSLGLHDWDTHIKCHIPELFGLMFFFNRQLSHIDVYKILQPGPAGSSFYSGFGEVRLWWWLAWPAVLSGIQFSWKMLDCYVQSNHIFMDLS